MVRSTDNRGIATVFGHAFESGTYTFTVIDVTTPPSLYDPSQNKETSDSVTVP